MKPIKFRYNDRIPWKIYTLSSLMIVLLSISQYSYSQDYSSGNISPINNPTPNYLRLNEVNRNASRHFMDHFLNNGNEKWIKENSSYIASFGSATVRNKAYYNSIGEFQFIVKSYGVEVLDKELKDAILQKFEGYGIKCVMEITDLEKETYFIKIANNENIKTLKCTDGKIEVTESFANGGI